MNKSHDENVRIGRIRFVATPGGKLCTENRTSVAEVNSFSTASLFIETSQRFRFARSDEIQQGNLLRERWSVPLILRSRAQ